MMPLDSVTRSTTDVAGSKIAPARLISRRVCFEGAVIRFGDGQPSSPLMFRLYASDLERAILGLSRNPMGATEKLRQALHRNDVDVRFGAGRQFVTMDGKTTELDAAANTEEVAQALNVTANVTALPAVEIVTAKPIDDAPTSNITGLQSGAFQDALAQMRQKIADRQKQAVGKILNAVEAGAAKMDAAADQVTAKVDKEISAALHEFAQYSNGAPE